MRKAIRAGLVAVIAILIGVGVGVSGIQNKALFYWCIVLSGMLLIAMILTFDPIWRLFSQRSPARSRTDREVSIINLLHRGDVLRARAPRRGAAPHAELPFNRDVDLWEEAVNRFLASRCAPGASAYFMEVRDMPTDVDQDLYTDAWAAARLLDWRMDRLREILTSLGDRYLS